MLQCNRRPVQPEVDPQLVNCDRDIIGPPPMLQAILIRRKAFKKPVKKVLIKFDEDVRNKALAAGGEGAKPLLDVSKPRPPRTCTANQRRESASKTKHANDWLNKTIVWNSLYIPRAIFSA
jgi:hypothetical protein